MSPRRNCHDLSLTWRNEEVYRSPRGGRDRLERGEGEEHGAEIWGSIAAVRAAGSRVRSRRRRAQVLLAGGALVVGLGCVGLAGSTPRAAAVDKPPAYLDTSLPFNVRAADLVSRMTMEEKLDQFRAMQPHSTFAAEADQRFLAWA